MPSSESKLALTPDGAIASYELEAVVDTAIEVVDEGTVVVLALVDKQPGGRRWEVAMEVHELDELLAALRKKRALVLQRKYGQYGHARGTRRGNR